MVYYAIKRFRLKYCFPIYEIATKTICDAIFTSSNFKYYKSLFHAEKVLEYILFLTKKNMYNHEFGEQSFQSSNDKN